MKPSETSATSVGNVAQFIALADEITRFAALAGVRVTPYLDPTLPIFTGLSLSKQRNTLCALGNQRDFFAMSVQESLPLDSVQLIWRTLSKMKLTPTSDIFERIGKEDTVEVYDADGVPSFKNLVFFRFISMTIEEIFSLPWHQQMTASPQLMAYFLEMGARLKLMEFKETFAPRFSEYSFYEKRGLRNRIHIHLKWVSPVKSEKGSQSLLFVNRTKLLKN